MGTLYLGSCACPVSPHLAVHEADAVGLMPQMCGEKLLVGVNCDSFWLVRELRGTEWF